MNFEKPPEAPEAEHDRKRLERIKNLIKEKVDSHPEFSDEQKAHISKHMLENPHHIWGDVNGLDMHFQSIKKNEAGDIEIEVWSDDGYMLGPDVIKLPDHLK
ncbi:hypothetical protein IT407_01020 [Candidatus Uhrbacteria bacterium]|nr:hypothetical protein [Candidatus Uhrbacteria bacterium]